MIHSQFHPWLHRLSLMHHSQVNLSVHHLLCSFSPPQRRLWRSLMHHSQVNLLVHLLCSFSPPSPLPSNASSPTVVPQAGNAPQHIAAASNALPQSTATPVSPPSHGQSSQPAAAPSDASSPPPAQNTASSQHAQAAAITTPLSPSLNSDLAHSKLADNPETSAHSSVPLIQASDGHRSGRNPVPSKCHEQMNEIDRKAQIKSTASVAAGHIEKENIPSTTPEWTIAAYDHLLKSDLGKDWTTCVRAWFELEQELGYGSRAKVCLLIFFSSLAGFNFVL